MYLVHLYYARFNPPMRQCGWRAVRQPSFAHVAPVLSDQVATNIAVHKHKHQQR